MESDERLTVVHLVRFMRLVPGLLGDRWSVQSEAAGDEGDEMTDRDDDRRRVLPNGLFGIGTATAPCIGSSSERREAEGAYVGSERDKRRERSGIRGRHLPILSQSRAWSLLTDVRMYHSPIRAAARLANGVWAERRIDSPGADRFRPGSLAIGYSTRTDAHCWSGPRLAQISEAYQLPCLAPEPGPGPFDSLLDRDLAVACVPPAAKAGI